MSLLFDGSAALARPHLSEFSLFPICRCRSPPALYKCCSCLRNRSACLQSLRLPRLHRSFSSLSHTFQLGPPSAAADAAKQYRFPDIRRVGRPKLKLVLGNMTDPNPLADVHRATGSSGALTLGASQPDPITASLSKRRPPACVCQRSSLSVWKLSVAPGNLIRPPGTGRGRRERSVRWQDTARLCLGGLSVRIIYTGVYVPRTSSVMHRPQLASLVKTRICLCHLLLFLGLRDRQSARRR